MADTSTPLASKISRARDFDDILEMVGSFGRYQKLLAIIIYIPVSFCVGFMNSLVYFELLVPDHWCHVPGREKTSLSVAQWHNLTIPRSIGSSKSSSCLMYEISWTRDANSTIYSVNNDAKECSDGWEFDTTQFDSTVATSLEWVCDRSHLSHHMLSVTMAGNAVGSFLFPILADKYLGRRLIFFICCAVHVVFNIPLLWVTNATLRMALRFLQGLATLTNFLVPYIIYLEVITPERRALAVMLGFLAWTLGMCFAGLVAWLVPQWQYLIIISITPSAVFCLYWRSLPESPRLLLSKGMVPQCADVLLKINAANGTSQVSRTEVEAQLGVLSQRQPVEQPLTAMLAYPWVTIRSLMLVLLWFVTYMIYAVIMLSMSVFSNQFLAHFVLSAFEIPSNLFGCAITHYLGRRFMAYSSFLLLAIFCLAAPFCGHSEVLLMTMLGFAKLFSTIAMYIGYVITSEVLPTPVRTSGTGALTVFGLLGMVASPHLLHYGESDGTHYWIMVALAIVCSFAVSLFPETLGLQLPQTFQDAEDLGNDRPFTSWIHHWNVLKFPQPSKPTHDECSDELFKPI